MLKKNNNYNQNNKKRKNLKRKKKLKLMSIITQLLKIFYQVKYKIIQMIMK